MPTLLRAGFVTLSLIAAGYASTDTFVGSSAVCLDVHNAGWQPFNKGSGAECVSRSGALVRQLDARAAQVSGYFWMPGDAGTRTDQAAYLDMPSERTSAAKGCLGAIVRGTFTDATHFSGYAAVWCRNQTTDTVRLLRFAANGSANATLTDLVTEISYTHDDGDTMLLTASGTTIRVVVLSGVTEEVNSSATDSTYASGRAGVMGITYTGTDHDGTRIDNFSSYDVPVLPIRAWYVSPSGAATNAGTPASPWSLEYAISSSAGTDGCADGWVRPGDTIWLRGGTYSPTAALTFACLGTVTHPITLAQYPGENGDIDGAGINASVSSIITLSAATYMTLRAMPAGRFKLFSSATAADSRTSATQAGSPPNRPGGVTLGLGARLVGLYMPDLAAGTGPLTGAKDTLVYGNRIINAGFYSTATSTTQGQCFYMQSNGAWQRYYRNLCANSWTQGYEAQGTGSSGTSASNLLVVENVFLNVGAPKGLGEADRVALYGGNAPSLNNVIRRNSAWFNSGLNGATCFAWYQRGTQGLTITNNRMACTTVSGSGMTSPAIGDVAFYAGVSGNKLYGSLDSTLTAALTDDTHSTTRPSSGEEFVYFPDYFRPGGDNCLIAHFGWAGATSITPDLIAGCGFANGDSYRVIDGQNDADVLASGTCSGTCAPSVAANKTVTQAWIGPNPQGAANPPVHSNASADGRRFSTLVAERTETIRNVTLTLSPQISYPNTARVLLEYGRSSTDLVIDAVPMHVTIARPAIGIVAVTIGVPAGQSLLYTTRAGAGPVYIPGGVPVTIAGATGSCTDLNNSWTTVAGGSLADAFRVATAPAGCVASGLAAATVLYQAASPAIMLSAGPSPLATGDSVTLSGGTADWACFDGTWTISDNTFNQFSGPTCAVTAAAMSGAVPSVEVNRNPLTYDVRLGAFPPGTTAQVTISGHTGKFAAANGVFTATIRPNGRFSIPVNGSGWGSAAGQAPSIRTARLLDMPTQSAACSAGCTITVPHFAGRMWHRWRYYDASGKLLAESDRMPVTIN